MVYRVVVFDIWGEFAHFRRFFTTSSPLSFSFPPPTTVRGIVGAILGLSKDEYIEATNRLNIGISVLSPVKKIRLGLNFVFTKGKDGKFEPTLLGYRKGNQSKAPRTQVQVEFLKDAKYRIYLSGNGNLLDALLKYLPYNKTEYTLSLGTSECLANYKFVGEFEAEFIRKTDTIRSVIPATNIENLDIEKPVRLAKEKVPVFMNPNRVTIKYDNVVLETSGKEFKGIFRDVLSIKELGENIYMFGISSQ